MITSDIIPTYDQSRALRSIRNWYQDPSPNRQIFYLAGSAGTGKTTVAALAIRNVHSLFAAFTGKAANVMRSKGIPNTSTIHSLAYRPISDSDPVRFELNPDSPLHNASVLTLDESSMVPNDIANDLISFGKKILALGDPAQLPPINGAGYFTNHDPDYLLTEIHRQAQDSPILQLATRIRNAPPLSFHPYAPSPTLLPSYPYDQTSPDGSSTLSIRRVNRADVLLPDYQVICGVHKVRWEVTQLIRSHLGYTTSHPEPGEKLICIQNDREEGIYNGQSAIVTDCSLAANKAHYRMRLLLEGETIARNFLVSITPFEEHVMRCPLADPRRTGIQRFDFGYVLTCHKSQGSEYENVVLIDDSAKFREDANRWLYTGITRASKNLIILRR